MRKLWFKCECCGKMLRLWVWVWPQSRMKIEQKIRRAGWYLFYRDIICACQRDVYCPECAPSQEHLREQLDDRGMARGEAI